MPLLKGKSFNSSEPCPCCLVFATYLAPFVYMISTDSSDMVDMGPNNTINTDANIMNSKVTIDDVIKTGSNAKARPMQRRHMAVDGVRLAMMPIDATFDQVLRDDENEDPETPKNSRHQGAIHASLTESCARGRNRLSSPTPWSRKGFGSDEEDPQFAIRNSQDLSSTKAQEQGQDQDYEGSNGYTVSRYIA